jgi:hypothetical protein
MGGRVLLEREGEGPVYRASLSEGERTWRGRAQVGADGAIAFADWEPADAPAWLVEHARAFLRVEWRARQGADPPPPWPARINRWRG